MKYDLSLFINKFREVFTMYYITVNAKNDRGLAQPVAKTLKAAKARYLEQMERKPFGLTFDDIEEIVVFKGNKIHGFYDAQFKLKKDVPVFIHNIIYGL